MVPLTLLHTLSLEIQFLLSNNYYANCNFLIKIKVPLILLCSMYVHIIMDFLHCNSEFLNLNPVFPKFLSQILQSQIMNKFQSLIIFQILILQNQKIRNCLGKRYFIIVKQIARHFVHYSECLYHPPSHLCNSNN